mgnify:CR=1 FL=1
MKDKSTLDIAANKIQWEASLQGINVVIKPSEKGECVVCYNPDAKKAVCVVESGKLKVATYDINVSKWMWALDEGFEVEDISTSKQLRNDIFTQIKFKEAIKYLS